MVQRRDILKTSLTLCGSAASGALGAEARADGPTTVSGTGYQLWFIGAQRETIMNGKTRSRTRPEHPRQPHSYLWARPARTAARRSDDRRRPSRTRARCTRRYGQRDPELRRRRTIFCLGRSQQLLDVAIADVMQGVPPGKRRLHCE
jgi:hypothetical protein